MVTAWLSLFAVVFAANPVTDAVRVVFPEHRKNLVAAFEAMPAEKYSFRPTPDLQTFGEMAVHIASAHYFYCRRLGGAAPGIRFPPSTAPKTQLVQLVADSLAYCARVIEHLTDASLGQPAQMQATATGDPPSRASVVLDLVSGMDHHYGQIAGYLRLNHVLPPTAAPKKEP